MKPSAEALQHLQQKHFSRSLPLETLFAFSTGTPPRIEQLWSRQVHLPPRPRRSFLNDRFTKVFRFPLTSCGPRFQSTPLQLDFPPAVALPGKLGVSNKSFCIASVRAASFYPRGVQNGTRLPRLAEAGCLWREWRHAVLRTRDPCILTPSPSSPSASCPSSPSASSPSSSFALPPFCFRTWLTPVPQCLQRGH